MAKLNWSEQGQALLNDYLKKNKKGSKAVIAVVGTEPGQIVFQAEVGKNSGRDWMAIGSLFCALDSALDQLHLSLKAKPSKTLMTPSGVWFEKSGPWLVIGSGLSHKPKNLKAIFSHLKKQSKNKSANKASLASEGLSGSQLDATMKEQWG